MVRNEPEDPDIDALQSAIDESRTVLDHQIDLVAKIDDIAMHTLRTSVLVIGLLVSVAGFAGQSIVASLSPIALGLFVLGLCSLFATVVFGLVTLSTSSLPFGISHSHRQYLFNEGVDQRQWSRNLLEEYGSWERKMVRIARANSQWLYYELWAFFSGTVALLLGTAVMIVEVLP